MHDNIIVVLTSFAVLLIVLILASPAQWRVRNTGTLLNIGWLLAGNLVFLINAIIWRDNVANSVPVWCDISVKIQTGFHTGICGASLCINRRLANIAASRSIKTNRASKIDLCIDMACGLVIPAVVMALSYVVQPNRFNIVEGYGCEFNSYPSIGSIFLLFIWPLVLSTVSAVYGVMAIFHFVSKRLQFRTILKTSKSGLDTSHFIRLMCIASTDLIVAVPVNIYFIVRTAQNLSPWLPRHVFYEDWDHVVQVPAAAWITNYQFILGNIMPRYAFPIIAFAFFALIGVTEEAVGEYLRLLRYVRGLTGLHPKKPVLPHPVTLGSTVSGPDGKCMVPDSAKSKDGTFGLDQYETPTSPQFRDRAHRVGISIDRQVA